MRIFMSASSLLTVLVLSGCAGLPCGNPHPYYSNTAGAPLKATPGVKLPAPDPSYTIPGEKPAAGNRTDLDASGACLVTPPEIITAESSANPKPASGSPAPAAQPKPAPAAGTIAPPAVASGGPIG